MMMRIVSALCLLLCISKSFSYIIAVTNDDGYAASGIVALVAALHDAGHSVVAVAPDGDQSGSGTKVDFSDVIIIKRSINPTVFSAILQDGNPAFPGTCANYATLLAADEFGVTRPDLLVSGINEGENLGLSHFVSGTVGAAIVASSLLTPLPVPSIAISTSIVECSGDETCIADQMRRVATWLVSDLIPNLAYPALLPKGVYLSVNHPFGEPVGAKLVKHGRMIGYEGVVMNLEIACDECGALGIGERAPGLSELVEVAEDSKYLQGDVVNFNNGFITVTPLVHDLNAVGELFDSFSGLAESLDDNFSSSSDGEQDLDQEDLDTEDLDPEDLD